jgi:hypothetical protein
MLEQRFVLLQVRQSLQDDPAHPREILNLGIDLAYLAACHVFSDAKHLQLVHHRRFLLFELVHRLGAPVGRRWPLVEQLSPPRNAPPVFLTVIGEVGKASLEPLEQGVAGFTFGYVLEQLVRHV